MENENIIQNQKESIKLSKMSKGYQWEIRLIDWEDDTNMIARLQRIDDELKERFPQVIEIK